MSDYPTQAHVDHWFQYHTPDWDKTQRYNDLRAVGKDLATVILALCPPCADRTDAIRKVREAVMIANAAIACDGR